MGDGRRRGTCRASGIDPSGACAFPAFVVEMLSGGPQFVGDCRPREGAKASPPHAQCLPSGAADKQEGREGQARGVDLHHPESDPCRQHRPCRRQCLEAARKLDLAWIDTWGVGGSVPARAPSQLRSRFDGHWRACIVVSHELGGHQCAHTPTAREDAPLMSLRENLAEVPLSEGASSSPRRSRRERAEAAVRRATGPSLLSSLASPQRLPSGSPCSCLRFHVSVFPG